MAVKLDSLKSDVTRERDGEWKEVPELAGVELLVRSLEFSPYKIAVAAANRRLRKRYGGQPVPPEIADVELGKILAEQILLGWKGLDVDYTPEIARETLADVAHRDLRAYVVAAAAQVGVAAAAYMEDAKGN